MSIEGGPSGPERPPREDDQGWGAEEARNPEAVLEEADRKSADALREAGDYSLRDGLDERYEALLSADEFWRLFDRRLALCDTPRTRSKAIKEFIAKAEGRFSEDQISSFAQMNQEHYAQ